MVKNKNKKIDNNDLYGGGENLSPYQLIDINWIVGEDDDDDEAVGDVWSSSSCTGKVTTSY